VERPNGFRRNTRPRPLLGFALVAILLLAVPAAAQAISVTARVESKGGTLLPRTTLTLSPSPVAPAGASAGETCPGNSVVGVVQAGAGGNWDGTWAAQTGWSVDRIKTVTAVVGEGRKWLVFVNGVLANDPPCQTALADNDTVTLYPACLTASTVGCFSGGLLDLIAPATAGPGAPITMQVWETKVTLDNQGAGTSQRGPGLGASVVGPEGSTYSDSYYSTGKATLTITQKGPSSVSVSKGDDVPDRAELCVTDGADGYCGTSIPTQVPFDPLAFCKTTGSDGYCGSPDRLPALGRITTPVQAQVFSATGRPRNLKGTVDFDPSQTDHVDLKLMRQTTVKVKRFESRKVWVTTTLHGKRVRKRVTRRRAVYVKKVACLGWNNTTASWEALKTCDAAKARAFRADGAEEWSFQFLDALPPGRYTLDAVAQDGAGNVDASPELGRNRITFTVN
jgi:hypothetical protein